MKAVFKLFVLAFLSLSSVFVQAKLMTPYDTASNVGEKLFSRIAAEKSSIDANPELMVTIVEEELMPFVDYKYAAYKILGKNLKRTNKAQRAKFVDTMRLYLVQTYAKALKQYDDQKVSFLPTKHDITGKKLVPVKALISEGEQSFEIVFKMRKNNKTKEWKAYDMVVEGISLLSSKQAEISGKIRASGIDQVTIDLANLTAS